MFSRCRKERRTLFALLLCAVVLSPSLISCAHKSEAKQKRLLRVCADPNNLPFSNQQQEGFENKIADLIAREMNATVDYTWWAQRRGFIRNTLEAGQCDVVMGLPLGFEMAATTSPYYRSTYVFVYKKDRGLNLQSFDDPALRHLRIGVQLIGDDFA